MYVHTYVVGLMDCLSVLFSFINNVEPGPEQPVRPVRQMSDLFSEASYTTIKIIKLCVINEIDIDI